MKFTTISESLSHRDYTENVYILLRFVYATVSNSLGETSKQTNNTTCKRSYLCFYQVFSKMFIEGLLSIWDELKIVVYARPRHSRSQNPGIRGAKTQFLDGTHLQLQNQKPNFYFYFVIFFFFII